jgi:Holliday junction resolvase RusA-like endonuclease
MKIFIPGEPIAQPRHSFRVIKTKQGRLTCMAYIPKDDPIHAYKQAIRLAYVNAGGEVLDGPVSIRIVCWFSRPKGHSKKRREHREPKISKPDLDNLAKAILDALNEIAYNDDGQVCRLTVEKWYVGGPYYWIGTEIEVVQ